jgi:hypothetical protein
MKGRLDLLQLDSIAHMFDLIVLAALNVEFPILRIKSYKVSCFVHDFRKSIRARLRPEAGRGSLRIVVISLTDIRAQQTKLAGLSVSYSLVGFIKNQVREIIGNMA